MKPANLKDTRISRGTARVKMLIRTHLYWLQGFPSFDGGNLLWCCPLSSDPEKRKINITYKQISKAVRTINELQREYPRALPEVVGDVPEWVGRAKKYLEYVKELFDIVDSKNRQVVFSLFDRDKAYGFSFIKSEYSKYSGMQSIVVALSWLYYIQREAIKPSIKFVANYPVELSSIADKSLFAAVEVIYLSNLEPDKVESLVWLVIYGKNDSGKVVGRVLVGMTGAGGIKVFHRYFHDKKEKFDELVLEYINEWAKEVGAILVKEGEIQKLVAPDWYDDGSIDIDSGIRCFNDGSDLRKKLPAMPPQDFLAEIERQLAPLPINELTFPMIIQLDEIQDNAELLSDLVGIAKKIDHIDDNTIVQLFKLSLPHDRGEYCYNLFNKLLMQGRSHYFFAEPFSKKFNSLFL